MDTPRILDEAMGADSLTAFFLSYMRDKPFPLYLTGGSVRDVLLGYSPGSDFDFVIECSAEEYEALLKPFTEEARANKLSNRLAQLDLMRTDDAIEYIRSFDITINSVAYDVRSRQLIDTTGVSLEDIKARRIRPFYKIFFLSTPSSYVRTFRFAATKNCAIDSETLSLLKNNHSMVCAGGHEGSALILANTFSFFNTPTIYPQFLQMHETQILQSVLPEALPCLTPGPSLFKFEMLHSLEKELAAVADVTMDELTKKSQASFQLHWQQRKKHHTFHTSPLACIRFALLLYYAVEEALRHDAVRPKISEQEAFFTNGREAMFTHIFERIGKNEKFKAPLTLIASLINAGKLCDAASPSKLPAQFKKCNGSKSLALLCLVILLYGSNNNSEKESFYRSVLQQ